MQVTPLIKDPTKPYAGNSSHQRFYKPYAVPGFDYFNLTAAVWALNLNQSCVSPRSSSNTSPCILYIAFCQNLDWLVLEPCKGSSVCQVADAANHSLGASSENPFASDDVPALQAKFFNGDPYPSASEVTCHLKTVVTFTCSRKAKWLVGGSTHTVKQAPWLRFIKFNANTCQMDIGFFFAGACKYPEQKEQVGAGTVVIIVFSISFFLYLVIGSLINVSQGRSGVEILPHHNFWQMLPTYIKEGFMFTFCRSSRRNSSDYSAI
ncbi:hypothetical protein RRG08_034077 [Elysia crispata]|uniref:Cation-dependent mannose-6-phosphate receptor n=1 Tax=Elysia crispata TaxID=231223 RepID=A0AAE1B5F7_9GAST|nr:hypothetical protein RRG08_034077 [Elysia crispata]